MLFTGDIEEIAEKQILKEYKDSKVLDADILKVAHHGSKTSSTLEFIQRVRPEIALIGVGKNNKFGHPNDGVLERLENLRCKNL
jgi:competence protein ComEC